MSYFLLTLWSRLNWFWLFYETVFLKTSLYLFLIYFFVLDEYSDVSLIRLRLYRYFYMFLIRILPFDYICFFYPFYYPFFPFNCFIVFSYFLFTVFFIKLSYLLFIIYSKVYFLLVLLVFVSTFSSILSLKQICFCWLKGTKIIYELFSK